MKYIAEHIQGHIQEGQKKEYNVFFVPRRTMICERVLEEEGVYQGEKFLSKSTLINDRNYIW